MVKKNILVISLIFGLVSLIGAVSEVRITLNGVPVSEITQGDAWGAVYDVAISGGETRVMCYFDANNNQAFDEEDIPIADDYWRETKYGVWDKETTLFERGMCYDADNEANGQVKLAWQGIYSLPVGGNLLVVTDKSNNTQASCYFEVKPLVSNYSISGKITGPEERKNILIKAFLVEPWEGSENLSASMWELTNEEGEYKINILSRGRWKVFAPPFISGFSTQNPTREVFVERHLTGIDFTYRRLEVEEAEIRGRVYEKNGHSLPQVTIEAKITIEWREGKPPEGIEIPERVTTQSKEDGTYSLRVPAISFEVINPELISSTVYSVQASDLPNYYKETPPYLLGLVPQPGEVISGVDFVYRALNSRVSGRVIGEDTGMPLEGARVEVFLETAPPGQPIASGITDNNGRYSLTICEGEYTMQVLPPPGSNYEERTLRGCFSIGDNESYEMRDIELPKSEETSPLPPGYVKGRVLDEAGNPIAGIRVRFRGRESAVTDAEGKYSFEASPGSGIIMIDRQALPSPFENCFILANFTTDPMAAIGIGRIEVGSEETLPGIDFTLYPRTSQLKGRIISGSGEGVAGVQLVAKREIEVGGRRLEWKVTSEVTSETGEYEVKVCSGEWEIKIIRIPELYKSPEVRKITFNRGEVKELNIRLESYIRLQEGGIIGLVKKRVMGEEEPVSNCKINIYLEAENRYFNARTDSSGRYYLNLPAGSYHVDCGETILKQYIALEKFKNPVKVETEPIVGINFLLQKRDCPVKVRIILPPEASLTDDDRVIAWLKIGPGTTSPYQRVVCDDTHVGREWILKKGNNAGTWVGISSAPKIFRERYPNQPLPLLLSRGSWVVEMKLGEQSKCETPPPQIAHLPEPSFPLTITFRLKSKTSIERGNLGDIDRKISNFPNPFTLPNLARSTSFPMKVKVYNILGQLVPEFSSKANPSGVYFYEIEINNRRMLVKKKLLMK